MDQERKQLSLKDIEEQTRALMAAAEGCPGLTIGEWVQFRLREAALKSILKTDFNERDIPIHQ